MSNHDTTSSLNSAGRRSGGTAAPGTRVAKADRASRLVLLKGAAPVIGVPYSTLRDHAGKDFPIVRIGRSLYAEWSDLDRFIEARKERA